MDVKDKLVTVEELGEAIAQKMAKAMHDAQNAYTASFDAIPEKAGWYNIVYTGSDTNAPVTTNAPWWWDVLQIGSYSRRVQIAFNCFRDRNIVWFRVKHDDNWYGWYKLTATT